MLKYENLIKQYPEFFIETALSVNESCMAFGVECGEGWCRILEALCLKLKMLLQENNEPLSVFRFTQIKEKYGTLYIYYKLNYINIPATTKIDNLIQKAEEDSETICEHCGKQGELYDDGWCITLCINCKRKYKNGFK